LLLLIALHVLRQLLSNIGFYLNDEAQRTADALSLFPLQY